MIHSRKVLAMFVAYSSPAPPESLTLCSVSWEEATTDFVTQAPRPSRFWLGCWETESQRAGKRLGRLFPQPSPSEMWFVSGPGSQSCSSCQFTYGSSFLIPLRILLLWLP